jgi:hypothetical protein
VIEREENFATLHFLVAKREKNFATPHFNTKKIPFFH